MIKERYCLHMLEVGAFLARNSLPERQEFAKRRMISLLLAERCPGNTNSTFDSSIKSSYVSSDN